MADAPTRKPASATAAQFFILAVCAVAMLVMVVRTWRNTPLWPVHEEWYLLRYVQMWQMEGFPAESLLVRFMEARQTVPFLFSMLALRAVQGDLRVMTMGCALLSVLQILLLWRIGARRWALRRCLEKSGNAVRIAAWAVGSALLLTSPMHFESLLWGWYWGPRLAFVLLLAGIVLLSVRRVGPGRVTAAILATSAAVFSMTYGTMGWIVGTLMLGVRRSGWPWQGVKVLLWCAAALVCTAAFMFMPDGKDTPDTRLFAFAGVTATVRFALAYLGAPIGISLLGSGHGAVIVVSTIFGALFIVASLSLLLQAWRRGWLAPQLAAFSVIVLVGIIALATGAGRAGNLANALTPRYLFISASAWVALMGLLAFRPTGTPRGQKLTTTTLLIFLCVGAMSIPQNWASMTWRKAYIEESRRAFFQGRRDDVARRATPDSGVAIDTISDGQKLEWPLFTLWR